MLENIEEAIKNGRSRETGNIGYTRQRKTKQKHSTICVGHHYTQINTNNVNKTRAPPQTQTQAANATNAEVIKIKKEVEQAQDNLIQAQQTVVCLYFFL